MSVNLMPFHAIRITPHSLIGLFNLKSKAIKVGGYQNPKEIRQAGISLAAAPLADAGFARARKIHSCPLIPPAAQATMDTTPCERRAVLCCVTKMQFIRVFVWELSDFVSEGIKCNVL